jgi:hypothetical protein
MVVRKPLLARHVKETLNHIITLKILQVLHANLLEQPAGLPK